jgi:hypothetical protein
MTQAEIIAKLKEAKGPDRKIDAAVFRYFAKAPDEHWYQYGDDYLNDTNCPKVTSSLDAAISLVEREKPGEWISITFNSSRENAAEASIGANYSERGATPAIALVIALIGGE